MRFELFGMESLLGLRTKKVRFFLKVKYFGKMNYHHCQIRGKAKFKEISKLIKAEQSCTEILFFNKLHSKQKIKNKFGSNLYAYVGLSPIPEKQLSLL